MAGADLPFACKGGMCCTCKARLTEGEVSDVHWGFDEEELAKGFISMLPVSPFRKNPRRLIMVNKDCFQPKIVQNRPGAGYLPMRIQSSGRNSPALLSTQFIVEKESFSRLISKRSCTDSPGSIRLLKSFNFLTGRTTEPNRSRRVKLHDFLAGKFPVGQW